MLNTHEGSNLKILFAASGLCFLSACSTTPPKRFVSEPFKRDDCLIVQEERLVEGDGNDAKTIANKTTAVDYSSKCEDGKNHRLKMKIAADILIKSFVDPDVAPEIKTKLAEKILKHLGSYDSAMRQFAKMGMAEHDITVEDLNNPEGVFTCKGDLSVYVDDSTGRTTVNFGECDYN